MQWRVFYFQIVEEASCPRFDTHIIRRTEVKTAWGKTLYIYLMFRQNNCSKKPVTPIILLQKIRKPKTPDIAPKSGTYTAL